MELTDFWFGTIAVLWIGYFFLEGFDFGVGVLLPVLGRTETDRLYAIGLAKEWSRHWSSSLSVTRYERRSSATVGDFEQNVVYLNLTYRSR